MTIEEMLRGGKMQTADNGFNYAVLPDADIPSSDHAQREKADTLAKMVGAVPKSAVPRLGRSGCYFVPWLYKQKRAVTVGLGAAAAGETRKELCHHLDVKPSGNLLIISLNFYQHDSYGLAMEFFDKVAYLATLETDPREDFGQLLRKQLAHPKPGELTPETWEWREEIDSAEAASEGPDVKVPASAARRQKWTHYARAAEADALSLYMASLFTDIFYEDLFEDDSDFPPLAPDLVYERVRAAERLYPANRGYSLQVVRQRPRRRANR